MSLFSRIHSVFRSHKLDQELDEELRSHLEMRALDNVGSGMSSEDAQLDARRRFGNPALIKESTRAQRIVLWLETVLQDARFGLRMLRRTPRFTLVAVLTVALTIGATAAVFTVVNSVLLRSLPYQNPNRLIVISTYMPRFNDETTASAQYAFLKANSRILEDAGAYSPHDYNVRGAGEAERVYGAVATASLFTTLGVQPMMGRVFTAEQDQPGAGKVAVMSYSLWQRYFNSDDTVVGKTIFLDSVPYTIVGVLPQAFRFPDLGLEPDVIVPAMLPPLSSYDSNQPMLIVKVIGRMKSATTLEQAHADLETVYQQYLASLISRFGGFFQNSTVHTRLLKTELVGSVRRPLLIIMTAVGCVLLIGCLNIASLQLARAVQRREEVGMRSALGAGKLRIVRQLITENLVLSCCGAAGGVLLAFAAAALVRAARLRALPHVSDIRVDLWVFAFTVMITIAAGFCFGLAPAMWVNRSDPAQAIGKGNRTTAGSGHRRLGNLLIVAELAVAVVLLAGAGLLVHSFTRLLAVDPGFDFHNVLTARVSFPLNGSLREQEPRFAFLDNATKELRSLPSVESVGATNSLPLQPYQIFLSVLIEGGPVPPMGMSPFVPSTLVSSQYFHTMKIGFVSGRGFNDSDTRNSTPVAIVNQAFARKFFPNDDPLGKRFRTPSPGAPPPWITIVGTVADIHHLGLAENVSPEIYRPVSQGRIFDMITFVVRTPELESTAAALRHIVTKLDADESVSNVLSVEQQLSESLAARRLNLIALGAFALLALVLAAVGIFGLLSYSVAQRSHEIGIRMAVGSDRKRVIELILREAAWLSLTGAICGIAAALFLTRYMSSLLYHTSPFDPATMISVSALLISVGILAGYLPARRASRLDPMTALRAE